ncbi:MAG: hypothetical protein ABIS06_17775 [Vicinamibacterales bacterium]
MNFAGEALTVVPTIVYRGLLPAFELAAHGVVAALAAAAGLAIWNSAPAALRLGTVAIIASAARTVQSLYFSRLPNNVVPGDEPTIAMASVVVAALALAVISRSERSSR